MPLVGKANIKGQGNLNPNGEKWVEEIARMLGGKSITSVSLKHALELLENAVPVVV